MCLFLYSIVISLPYKFFGTKKISCRSNYFCFDFYGYIIVRPVWYIKLLVFITFLSGIVIPLAIMAYCSCGIYKAVRISRRSVSPIEISTWNKLAPRLYLKSAQTCLMLAICFFLTITPLLIVKIMQHIGYEINADTKATTQMIYWTGVCLKPMISVYRVWDKIYRPSFGYYGQQHEQQQHTRTHGRTSRINRTSRSMAYRCDPDECEAGELQTTTNNTNPNYDPSALFTVATANVNFSWIGPADDISA